MKKLFESKKDRAFRETLEKTKFVAMKTGMDWLKFTRHFEKVCTRAIEAWGREAQLWIAAEEMSELTKELSKNMRGEDNIDAIAEEVADVEIMLEQIKIIFGCRVQAARKLDEKLDRLDKRVTDYLDPKKGGENNGEA